MIDIKSDLPGEAEMLDFTLHTKAGRKYSFTLPALGRDNIPFGMMAAVSIAQEAMITDDTHEQARALYALLESMKGQFPDQYKILWSVDFETAVKFFEAWLTESAEKGGFDPKASSTTPS